MIAASAVIVSHAYPLSVGVGTVEPLEGFLGFSLGRAAVKCFFAISGYFIFLSFDRRKSNLDFLIARALRILPALAVMSLVLALLVGPWFTAFPVKQYFVNPETWAYPSRAATIFFNNDELPGVFTENPFPLAVNGSLWTLQFEISCYAMLFSLGVTGLHRRSLFPLFLTAYAASYLAAQHAGFANWNSLSLPFVLGMSAYIYRKQAFLSGRIAAMLVAAAVLSSLAGRAVSELWSVAIAYGSLWTGFAALPRLHVYNRLGDYSYGTYIYAFPIQQILAASIPQLSPLQMMALTFPPTILLAVLSWHLLEKPAMELRMRFRGSVAPIPAVSIGIG